jgi:hypothetical protein
VNPDPIRIQGFEDQNLKKKKIQQKILFIPLLQYRYLCPSYRKSLQPSKKENIGHFKK